MEPTISTGSIILIDIKTEPHVEDIVTYQNQDTTITHRIKNQINDQEYITKGDANDSNDPVPVYRIQIIGKVILSIPFIGYIVMFLRRYLWLLCIAFLLCHLIQEKRRNIWKSKIRKKWDDLADTDHNGIPDIAEDIIPNKNIPKDPAIENTGKNPAWVYLEVRVPIVNIIIAQADGSRASKADTELFLFTPDLDNWIQLSKIIEEDTDGKKTAVYVFGYETVLDPGQTTAELFTQVQFCNAIEEQGLEDSKQTINVKSMAIQQEESGTMEEAYGKFINQEHITETDTAKPGNETTDTTEQTTEGQDE